MEKTCFEIQKEILQQKTANEVFNKQIDIYLEEATTNLKQLIIQKQFISQRVLVTELYCSKHIQNPLELSPFVETENDVESNFASLDLPDDISKNPIKAFLNNLFDNLDTFLPSLSQLTNECLNNFSNSTLETNPLTLLFQCVFPSLFGYCWAEEAATSYGHYLASWFENIYKSNPNFLKEFESHWLSQAIKGYFISIDISNFIHSVITPIFYDFVQLDAKTEQNSPEILLSYAIRILNSIHENFEILHSCLNNFLNEILAISNDDEIQKQLIQLIFYNILIRPCFKNPILYNVSEFLLPESDYINFSLVYDVFLLKFGLCSDDQSFQQSVSSIPAFSAFDPFVVRDDIVGKKGKHQLPLLHEFCNKVQCAHHPLILSTHYLAVLFRFSESLLQSNMLPKSLERPLNTIIQDTIPEKLEKLADHLFWFPCYSLTYLNVPPVTFLKDGKTSSLYRLLSSDDLRVSPLDADFVHALTNAGEAATLTTHPELRTEVEWLNRSGSVSDSFSLLPSIENEIQLKNAEIRQKQERCLELVCFAETMREKLENISNAPQMALAAALLPEFNAYSKADILSSVFMTNIKNRIKEFCQNAFVVMGKFLAQAILVQVTPVIKKKFGFTLEKWEKVDSGLDEKMLIDRPIVLSSCFSVAKRLLPSLQAVAQYEAMSGEEDVWKKFTDKDFIEFAEETSSCLSSLLFPLPSELLTLDFSIKDLEILKIFTKIFEKKK